MFSGQAQQGFAMSASLQGPKIDSHVKLLGSNDCLWRESTGSVLIFDIIRFLLVVFDSFLIDTIFLGRACMREDCVENNSVALTILLLIGA